MKTTNLKPLLASLVVMLASLSLSAHDVVVNGIYYYLYESKSEAHVTYRGSYYYSYNNEYSGDVTIPSTITTNGVTYNVTHIGEQAFYGCSGLTSITIPESVTSFGSWAFYDCTGSLILNCDIPDGTYNSSGFVDHSKFTSVTINGKSIGDYAFNGCSTIETIQLSENVTRIGSSAFHGCKGLTSVTIPSSVTIIGKAAFRSCTGLTSVTIPESVTSIGESAFYGCSGLTSLTIPEGVTSIGNSAFYNCSGLTSITLPESVTSIESYAFSGCSGLTKAEFASIEHLCSIKFWNNSSNPLCYAKHLFVGGEEITEVVIPESVTSIGSYAFSGCTGLTSVTIPESVTSIGGYAFEGCTGLTSLTIPESVTSIGGYAFQYCTSLTEPVYNKKIFASFPISYQGDYTIPKGIETICSGAFYNCESLNSLTIPESVTSIGRYAFSGCTGTLILNCDIPDGAQNNYPLGGSKFTSVTVNGKSIGDYAFYNCSTIESIQLSENVTRIGSSAFSGCSGLTSLTIPESVTSIGNYAFSGCTGLTKAEFASIEQLCGIKFYDSASNPLSYAHHLYINGEEVIELVIPESVDSIGELAFYGCTGLTSLTIPESVVSIGDKAFSGCTGIKTVNALSATPPTAAANSFDGVSGTAFLYVPLGCEEAYGTATGWSKFTHLREKDFGTKDCLLTLKGFNGGCVALKCKTRSTYAFQIHAEEGWKVSSLTFNGEDATASIAADGSYTTPSLTDDSELCVVFEEDGSAVGEISTEDVLRVSASGCVLSVQNEGEAVQATIFTTDGRQVKSIEAKRGTTQVRLAEGQVYLVKVDGRTFKVAM